MPACQLTDEARIQVGLGERVVKVERRLQIRGLAAGAQQTELRIQPLFEVRGHLRTPIDLREMGDEHRTRTLHARMKIRPVQRRSAHACRRRSKYERRNERYCVLS